MIAEKEARWQFLKFLVAAGLSVPVNLGSRVLLSRIMPYEAAVVVSHLCGMLTAFLLTRSFVFERSGRRASNELARFTHRQRALTHRDLGRRRRLATPRLPTGRL